MAIRTQRLEAQPRQRTPEEWKLAVSSLIAEISQAIAAGDRDALQTSWQKADSWSEADRRLQLDIMVFQLLTETSSSKPQRWGPMFLSAGETLLARLQERPLEPLVWNMLGIALFELGEYGAAEQCFRAALRLQPEYAQAERNRRAAKSHKKGQSPKLPFSGAQLQRQRQLGKQAAELAGQARLPDPATLKLSLVMIVKDEQEMLPDCLASVQDVVDEMIVVDTGSSDRTVQIAEEYGARVIHFPWTGSFAEARNVSLEHATGDWVLQLDADERLVQEDSQRVRPLLARVYREAFSLVETNYTGDGDEDPAVVHSAIRLWRHRPHYRFEGAIHEQKTQHMPIYLPERFENTDLRLLHYGYLKDIIRDRDKSSRNLQLLEVEAQQNPSPFNRFNLGNEYLVLGQPEQALDFYEQAWSALTRDGALEQVGFTGMLALRRTRAARQCGRLEEADRFATEGLALFPESTDMVVEQALAARGRGDLERALQLGQLALQMGEAPAALGGTIGAGSFLARGFMGSVLEALGRPSDAVSIYRDSLAEDPQYLGSVGNLARALLSSGVTLEATLAELQPIIDRQPVSAGLLVAHSLYELQHIAAARQLYRQVWEAHAGDRVARGGLVECALSDGDLEEVLRLCAEVDPSDPTAPVLLRSALFARLLRGEYAEARQLLTRRRELRLAEDEAELFASWTDMAAGDPSAALSVPAATAALPMLEAALRLRQLDAAQQLILLLQGSDLTVEERSALAGPVFLRQGYLDSAADAWLEWIDHAGPTTNSLLGLARVAWAQEKTDQALKLARDALSLDAQHQEAQQMVRVLERQAP